MAALLIFLFLIWSAATFYILTLAAIPIGTMKQFRTDIIIFIGLLILASLGLLLTVGQDTIDIQLHDTYLVIDKVSMTVLIIGPLAFLIFLARGLTKKFKAIGANIGLIIGLILLTLITYYVIRIQQAYLNEAVSLGDEGFPAGGQFIVGVKKKMNWTWVVFGLLITGLLLLTYRTMMIWKDGYSSQQSI